MVAPAVRGIAMGWQGTYYFKPVKQETWYLSLHAYSEKYTSHGHASSVNLNKEGLKSNFALGKSWRNFGLRWMFGAGAEYQNHTIEAISRTTQMIAPEASNEGPNWLPFIEFKVL